MNVEEFTVLVATLGIVTSLLLMLESPFVGLSLILANIIVMFIVIHSIHMDGK